MGSMDKKKARFLNRALSAQDETRTHTILRPLPPQSSVYTNFTTCAFYCKTSIKPKFLLKKFRLSKSGKRDSNSRPQPWQGCALPTELFPLVVSELVCFLIASAKLRPFFELARGGRKILAKNYSEIMAASSSSVNEEGTAAMTSDSTASDASLSFRSCI